jgi:hypothetical protein
MSGAFTSDHFCLALHGNIRPGANVKKNTTVNYRSNFNPTFLGVK